MYLKVVNPMIGSYFLLISIIIEKGLNSCLLLIGFVTLAKKNSQNVFEKIRSCSRTRPRGTLKSKRKCSVIEWASEAHWSG